MFCVKCGKEVPVDANVCPHCGNPAGQVPVNPVAPTGKTKKCKHCQTLIPKKAKICPQCGKRVKGGVFKWILIAIVALIFFVALAGGCDDNDEEPKKVGEVSADVSKETSVTEDENSEELPKKPEESSEEVIEADVQTVYHVGDILQDGDLKIVYISSGDYEEDNDFLQPQDGNKYIYIQLAFENTASKGDQYVSAYSFEGYADGYNVEMYYGADDTLSSTLSAGRSTSGYLYFEVPENAEEIQIEYETNFFTEDKITFAFDGDKDSGYVLEAKAEATDGAIKVGEVFESSDIKITYLKCFADDSDNMFITPKEGHHFVTCEFEFENLSDSDQSASFYSFDCYADGIDCDGSYFRDDALSATLSAGRKAKGTVTFEVPDDASIVEVEYLDNMWTSDRVVFSVDEK